VVVRKAAQSLEAALGLLASSGARVVRRKSRAVLVHMRVRRLRAHFREREGVLAKELAQVVVRVGGNTLRRARALRLEKLERVHVRVRELPAVHRRLAKEPRVLPHVAHEDVAAHALAHRLRAVVVALRVELPVTRDARGDVPNVAALGVHHLVQLRDGEARRGVPSDERVPGREPHLVRCRHEAAHEREKNLDDLPLEARRAFAFQ